MFRSKWFKVFLIFNLAFTTLFFAGCGGSSSDHDSGGTATQAAMIDEASVTEEMEFIEASIPGCRMAAAAEIAAGIMGSQLPMDASGALVGLFATLNAARSQTPEFLTSIDIGPLEFQGDCGGSLSVTITDDNGATTFILVFNEFCSFMEKVNSQEEVKVSGRLIASQVGTNGGLGVAKYTTETDGALIVEAGTEAVSVSLDNVVYTLGSPGAKPGEAIQVHPDRISLDQVTVNFETRKRVMTLTDLRAITYASDDDKIAEITSGRLSMRDRGYVDVSTSQPIVMNSDGDILSGALDFAGADGNIATVIAGIEPGKFILEINGEPISHCMDCSDFNLSDISLPILF